MLSPDQVYTQLCSQQLDHMRPIDPSEKMMLGSDVDINQLSPMKYPWAYDFFNDGISNNWTPEETPMSDDIAQYKRGQLTEEEKHVFVNVLAYLTTSDIMVARNIATALFDKLPVPEVQLFLGRQTFEEGLHQKSYQHCIETLNLDQGYVYNLYRTIPEIYQKLIISQSYTDALTDPAYSVKGSIETTKFFLQALIFYGLGFEGIWFYNGFTPVFALQRMGKMKGTGEQFQYIMRDEALHARFYTRAIRQIIIENPQIWDDDMRERAIEVFKTVVRSEEIYIGYIMRDPILGYNKEMHVEQAKWLANLRGKQIGLPDIFPGAERTVPWLDEQANVRKEKNFFETRVNEYQSAGTLRWD